MSLTEFLIDWTLRSVVVVALMAIPIMLWKRASGAQRHGLWLCALVGILVLPFLTFLPKWRLPSQSVEAFTEVPSLPMIPEESLVPLSESREAVVTSAVESRWTWRHLLLTAWMLGVVYHLLRWVLGQRMLSRWRSRAESWSVQVHEGTLVRYSHEVPGPLVAGLFRPMILLPDTAKTWNAARLDAVLAHEVAHVRRCDLWSHSLGTWLSIAQWWNPLIHLAVRQMEQASERACDDRVLNNGIPATDYSMTLLEVAREASLTRGIPKGAVTMARTLPIEKRLERLLDTSQSRSDLGASTLIGLLVSMALLATSVGTFTSQAQEPEDDVVVPPSKSDNMWSMLATVPGWLTLTVNGDGTISLIDNNTIVSQGDVVVSGRGFSVAAEEISLSLNDKNIEFVSATSVRFAGPENLSGTCGHLIWNYEAGTVELRDGVRWKLVGQANESTRHYRKRPDDVLRLRLREGGVVETKSKEGKMIMIDQPSQESRDQWEQERGFFGATMVDSATLVDRKRVRSVQVANLVDFGAAMRAGIREGDQIYAINGERIPEATSGDDTQPSLQNVVGQIGSMAPGAVVTLDVMRGGKKMKFDVTLGRRSARLR